MEVWVSLLIQRLSRHSFLDTNTGCSSLHIPRLIHACLRSSAQAVPTVCNSFPLTSGSTAYARPWAGPWDVQMNQTSF